MMIIIRLQSTVISSERCLLGGRGRPDTPHQSAHGGGGGEGVGLFGSDE